MSGICPHLFGGLPAGACGSRCQYKPELGKLTKPRVELPKPVGVTPFEVHVAQLEAGIRCPDCWHLRDDHGFCFCERAARYAAVRAVLWAELDAGHLDEFVFRSGIKRAGLMLGRDTPSLIPGQSIMQLEQILVRERFKRDKPERWRKFKVTEPTEGLPV